MIAVAALSVGAVVAVNAAGILDDAELKSIDVRFHLRGSRRPRKDLVLVAVDNKTLSVLDRRPPYPRSFHARLIDFLHPAGIRNPHRIGAVLGSVGVPSGADGEVRQMLYEPVDIISFDVATAALKLGHPLNTTNPVLALSLSTIGSVACGYALETRERRRMRLIHVRRTPVGHVYDISAYRHWERELGREDVNGQFGENFTVEGLADDEVCVGDRYRIGGALFAHIRPRSARAARRRSH